MRLLNYFQYRIAIIFGIFGILLSSLFGFSLFVSIHKTDDELRRQLLTQFQTKAIEHYQNTDALLSGDSVFEITVLRSDRDAVDDYLTELTAGYYEFTEQAVHVIKGVLPSQSIEQSVNYYLIHHSDNSHAINKNVDQILFTIVLIVLFVSVVGISIGLLLSRQIARPVQALQQQIRSTDPTDIAHAPLERTDEFGELSQAYNETLERIRQAFEREKRFSSYASHELRTPVAIIKSSLNLWQTCNQIDDPVLADQKKNRAFQRIAVASYQMEAVIQTFLLLSKRSFSDQESELIDLRKVITEHLDKFQSVESYQHIKVKTQMDSAVSLQVNRLAANVIFSTLLRNSFEYCAGNISIRSYENRLIFSNNIDQLKIDQAEHFGFGLEIVRQLCDQLGWRVSMELKDSLLYVVEIIYRK